MPLAVCQSSLEALLLSKGSAGPWPRGGSSGGKKENGKKEDVSTVREEGRLVSQVGLAPFFLVPPLFLPLKKFVKKREQNTRHTGAGAGWMLTRKKKKKRRMEERARVGQERERERKKGREGGEFLVERRRR